MILYFDRFQIALFTLLLPFLLQAQGGNKGDGKNLGNFRAFLKAADSLFSTPKHDPFADIPFDFDQRAIDSIAALYPKGTVHCVKNRPTLVVEVLNPITGRTWMDRNLGAHRAAISVNDSMAFGDLYQWGRGPDGHQCRNSKVTDQISNTDQPGHGDFILISKNWRIAVNQNLWQGVDGINNPCPKGFRLPTDYEWKQEVASWGAQTIRGGYESPLKLTSAGRRTTLKGEVFVDGYGVYFGSTPKVPYAMGDVSHIYYSPSELFADRGSNSHFSITNGSSVRCIKDRSAK